MQDCAWIMGNFKLMLMMDDLLINDLHLHDISVSDIAWIHFQQNMTAFSVDNPVENVHKVLWDYVMQICCKSCPISAQGRARKWYD